MRGLCMDDRKQALHFFAILIFAALYVAFGCLYALDKRDTSNVLYEIFRDKVHAANQAEGDARILLVGGSNTVWGFRSQIVEDESGLPTFNLALTHEAYDPMVMRALVLNAVAPGDTVVYSSVTFWNARNSDPPAAAELLRVAGLDHKDKSVLTIAKENLERYWSPYPQKSTIITSLPALYRRYVLHEPSVHMRDLNSKGDVARCLTPGAAGRSGFRDPAPLESYLQALQNFEHELRLRGASLIVMVPPNLIVPDDRERWVQAFGPLVEAMQTIFTMAPPALEESLYTDVALFCDTEFHLADSEAERRSRILGQYLRERTAHTKQMTGN